MCNILIIRTREKKIPIGMDCRTVSSFSLCLPSKIPFLLRNRQNFSFSGSPLWFSPGNPSSFSLSASIAEKTSSVEFSWSPWEEVAKDDYNGWEIAQEFSTEHVNRGGKSFHRLAVIGAATSVVGVLGLLGYFSFSSKVFRSQTPFEALPGFWVPSFIDKKENTSEEVAAAEISEDTLVPNETMGGVAESVVSTEAISSTPAERKPERILVSFTVDSTQQEAISSLKKLKIIEDDARADELCTRREYARWLVRTNSQLERRRKYRINASAALSTSAIVAFDDVGVEDSDFEFIQSLAEVGVVMSRLSIGNSGSDLEIVREEGRVDFYPDRFISRQDLVTWRAKLEYEASLKVLEEMSRKNIGFLDVKEISSDALVEVFVDILAGEKSIIRRVFGQCKRLQPHKPCTKAQAAVALASGRMTEFIQAEISRLVAENISRQNEIKEIISELLERGDIQQYWERKIEEERKHRLEVEVGYRIAVAAVEQEKILTENALEELVKQRASLDCQKELLSSLKSEVMDMSEKLSFQRARYIDEQHAIQDLRHDLEVKLEGLLNAKSILEAEVEALRILRSWVEEEARKNQTRAKFLEEAARRWKWDS